MQPSSDWTPQIESLKTFFDSIELPKQFQLLPYLLITDTKHFVESHLRVVIQNNGKRSFLMYYYRLLKLKYLLEKTIVS